MSVTQATPRVDDGRARGHVVADSGGELERRDLEPRALSLRETCARLGISVRTGEGLLAQGRFPVPALPRIGRSNWKFSSIEIDDYLRLASTRSVRGRR